MNPGGSFSMSLPLVLMAVIAPVALVDIAYFHMWRFRLYQQPSARGEVVTHLLRGAFFSFGAFVLSTYRPEGLWFWAIGGLFLLDFLNNLVDVALEPASRAPLGGLPPLEYIIHIGGAAFAGAVTLAYFVAGWSFRTAETALASAQGTMPAWLIWQGRLMAVGAASLTLLELGLLLGSVCRAPRRALA